jgi:hypothetical protein
VAQTSTRDAVRTKKAKQVVSSAGSRDIPVAALRFDPDTQPRVELDEELIAEYAEGWESGVSFPPIVVFEDGPGYWIGDGFHRSLGAKKAGRETIPADVRPGTKREAILYSVGANSEHGKRRTNEDKRRAVMILLNDEEWHRWSDTEIARRSGVSVPTVGRHRPGSIYNNVIDSGERKVKRGDREFVQKTGKIGRTKVPEVSPKPTPTAEPFPGNSQDSDESGAVPPAPPRPTPVASTNGHPTPPVPPQATPAIESFDPAEVDGTEGTGPDADEPPNVQADVQGTPSGSTADLSDPEWLVTLRAKLTDHTRRVLERDAIKYRAIYQSDQFKSFVNLARRVLKEKQVGQVIGHFHSRMTALLNFPHPRDWIACPECSGRGIGARGDCVKCFGRGYLILKGD